MVYTEISVVRGLVVTRRELTEFILSDEQLRETYSEGKDLKSSGSRRRLLVSYRK